MDQDRGYGVCSPHDEGQIFIRFTATDDNGNYVHGSLKELRPDVDQALKAAIEIVRAHLENNIKP